jgi:hypothetical protein
MVTVAPAAHAATCSGLGYSWVGLGDGTSWTNTANWDPNGVPGPNDSADISLIAGGSANIVSDSVTVCDLTIGGAVLLNTGVGGMTVNNLLDWHAAQSTSVISGSLTALGSSTLTSSGTQANPGSLVFASSDGITAATLTFAGAAQIDAGTFLSLTNNLSNINVTGSLKLGAGSQIQSTVATSDDTNAKLVVNGTVTLDGNASTTQVDVNVGATGVVDLVGYTWTDTGLSWSRWLTGALAKSTGVPGTFLVTGGAGFMVDGNVTLNSGVTLAVDGGSLITDGEYFNGMGNGVAGGQGTLTGAGTLDVRSAKLGGILTLDTGFHTLATTTGTRLLDAYGYAPAPALWVNNGTMTVKGGTFGAQVAPSVLLNNNQFNVCVGVTLSGVQTASDASAMFHNGVMGTMSVLAATDPGCTGAVGTTVVDDGFNISNEGLLNVSTGTTLSLLGLSPYQFLNNSQITGGGRVETGDNTVSLTIDQSVPIINGSTLSLNHGATLVAGLPSSSANLSAGMSTGTFEWVDGTVTGVLTTSGTLTSNVIGGATGTRTLGAASTWTVLSPTNMTASQVQLSSDAAVNINAMVRLSGAKAGFGHVAAPIAGKAVVINSGGTLVSSSGTSAVIDFPLVNKGNIHLGASSTLDAGYGITQNGSAAVTHIDAGETFKVEKSGVGSAMGTFTMSAGKFFGGGTLYASLTQSGGVVEAGMSHAKVGTLSVKGGYTQTSAGLLGLTLKSASSHSVLRVSGAVSVKGKVEFDVNGFRPKVGSKVTNLVIGKSVGGKFIKVTNIGVASHTAWKPVMAKTTIGATLFKE